MPHRSQKSFVAGNGSDACHVKKQLPDATFLQLTVAPDNKGRSPTARLSMLAALATGSIEVRVERLLYSVIVFESLFPSIYASLWVYR